MASGWALLGKAKRKRDIESFRYEAEMPEFLEDASNFLKGHETACKRQYTHSVFENYTDWWTSKRPTYRLDISDGDAVNRLHDIIAMCYQLGLPLTLSEARSPVFRFVLEVDIWGREGAGVGPGSHVGTSELLDTCGPFLRVIGRAMRELFPAAGENALDMDLVVFDATGRHVSQAAHKTSLRLVWPTVVVDAARAKRVRDHIVERFVTSTAADVVALGDRIAECHTWNSWYTVFRSSFYTTAAPDLRMPLCDRVTPAPLKKPEGRPFQPLGIWRITKPKLSETNTVTWEQLFFPAQLPNHLWVRAGSIRLDGGEELTDWTEPECLESWAEGPASNGIAAGAWSRKKKARSWATAAPAGAPMMGPRAPRKLRPLVPVRPPERFLGCASPFCDYLVHSSSEYGGFCCRKCHLLMCNPYKAKRNRHGPLCEKEPRADEATADPTPPNKEFVSF